MTISRFEPFASTKAADVDATATFISNAFLRFAYGLPSSTESKFRIGSNMKLPFDAIPGVATRICSGADIAFDRGISREDSQLRCVRRMRAARMWRRILDVNGVAALESLLFNTSSLRHRERLAALLISSSMPYASPINPARLSEANDVSNRGNRIASS